MLTPRTIRVLLRRCIEAFFVVLPFIYACQVYFMTKLVVLIPYSMIVVAWLLHLLSSKPNARMPKPGETTTKHTLLDDVVVFFSIMISLWILFELTFYGFESALRLFLIFFLPVTLYFLRGQFLRNKASHSFLAIITLTASVVAAELLYEIVHTKFLFLEPTAFQKMNYEYVAALGTGELSQLVEAVYKSPGLLEHAHASAAFVGIGVIGAITLWVTGKQNIWMYVGGMNLLILMLSAVRTAQLATFISVMTMGFLLRRNLGARRRITRVVIGVIFVVCLGIGSVGIAYPGELSSLVKSFYGGVPTGDVFQDEDTITGILDYSFWHNFKALNEHPTAVLFGVGPTTLMEKLGAGSDDFFVIQVFAQFGLMGGLLFYSIPILALWEGSVSLKRVNSKDAMLITGYLAIIVLLFVTTIHSGVLQRKGIFPVLWLSLAVVRFYSYSVITGISGRRLTQMGARGRAVT